MANPNRKPIWQVVNGVMSRFYNVITKSFKIEGEAMKRSVQDVTISVPQTLDEVPEHSELTALELCQWSIAYKRYLMIRELLPTETDVDTLEMTVNARKVGSRKEMSITTQITRRVKDADLTPEQALELQARMDKMIEEITSS